eukprot:4136296-Amphidinium_carterae.1
MSCCAGRTPRLCVSQPIKSSAMHAGRCELMEANIGFERSELNSKVPLAGKLVNPKAKERCPSPNQGCSRKKRQRKCTARSRTRTCMMECRSRSPCTRDTEP